LGVEYTEEYGRGCITATINPQKTNYTIGIRADMDALPIAEENDVPYKSRIDGKMHACGHDAHTAIALTALKELYEIKNEINCQVKFFFQSGEEAYCGAKYMVEDGAADDVDCIVALHVDVSCETGKIMIRSGALNANADHFTLEFFGKSSHAAHQQDGIDANMAAIRSYTAIQFMISKEVATQDVVVFNAGEIKGGTASNIISDYCCMNCTLRTWNDDTENKLLEGIKRTIDLTAQACGAEAKFTQKNHYLMLINNESVANMLKKSAVNVIGEENVLPLEFRGMGAEDFAYFANAKPACMFKLGVRNKEKDILFSTHTSKFDIDENALDIGIKIFKQFVFDNMNNKKILKTK